MAQLAKDQAIKYLTAYQLVMAVLFYVIQIIGLDTDRKVALAIALVALAAFVYKKDKEIKKELYQLDLSPTQEDMVRKALDIIKDVFGFKMKNGLKEELLKKAEIVRLEQELKEIEEKEDG